MIPAEFADKVLQLLASVGETDQVLNKLDLPLYDYQVLDSMRTVQLISATLKQIWACCQLYAMQL